uniref:CASTOR1 N-terminal domain-containing protein n=1 Tax=Seriola lalandi dorsalis TaxID=1841481 RepID=A0A3B4XKG3_SERLL
MELHILEHSLKVASIEKEGIQICTHFAFNFFFSYVLKMCSS